MAAQRLVPVARAATAATAAGVVAAADRAVDRARRVVSAASAARRK
nr:hypothetical protein [uncultured Rhodopila sp.]